jgi:hypothetical protein
MEELFRKNPRLWAVALYLFMVAGFLFVKPSVAFGPNGEIKPFGTKKKGTTIFPVWWWMFVFAAMSYISVAVLTNFKM